MIYRPVPTDWIPRTIAYAKTGSTLVLVCNRDSISDREWVEYCDYIRRHVGPLEEYQVIAISHGAHPDANQRQHLYESISTLAIPRMALLTASRLASAAATALRWISGVQFKAFSPDRLEEAMDYVGVLPPDRRLAILDMVERLSWELQTQVN